jgi:hypothetical protein
MLIAILTIEQRDLLFDNFYDNGISKFLPIESLLGNWFITKTEIDNCTNVNFKWVKSLPLTKYENG